MYYKPKIWTSKTEELQQESQRKLKGIHVTVCALYDVSYNLPNLLEMLETRRKELEEELVRVEEKANARLERVRERGSQVVPANEQDAELEELEAEIEMYALALGEEKEEDMELNPEEASQGPLTFPKHDPDETMDSAWPFKNKKSLHRITWRGATQLKDCELTIESIFRYCFYFFCVPCFSIVTLCLSRIGFNGP